MSRYGNYFERRAILDWLNKGNNYCPVTGNPLRPSNLVSCQTLQWKIRYWAKKNGQTDFVREVEEAESKASIGEAVPQFTLAVPPKNFVCPLTTEVMTDPVMTRNGPNFERKAILEWLENNDTCPVTNQPLTPAGVVANKKLEWEIRQWQLHHGDASQEMSRLELESKLSKAEMVSRDFQLADILRTLTMEDYKHTSTKENEGKLALGDSEECSDDKPDILSVLDEVVDALDM